MPQLSKMRQYLNIFIAAIVIYACYVDAIKVNSKVDLPETSSSKHHLHRDRENDGADSRSPGIVSAVLEVNLVPTVNAKGTICVKGRNGKCVLNEEEDDNESDEVQSSEDEELKEKKKKNTNIKVVSGLDDPVEEIEDKSDGQNEDNNEYEDDTNEGPIFTKHDTKKKKKKGLVIPDVPVYIGSFAGVKNVVQDYSDFNVRSAWNYRKPLPPYYPEDQIPIRRDPVYGVLRPFNTARPSLTIENYPGREYKKVNYFRRSAVFDIPDHVENQAHFSPSDDYYNAKQIRPLVTNTPRPYHRIEHSQDSSIHILEQPDSPYSTKNLHRSPSDVYGKGFLRERAGIDDKINFRREYIPHEIGDRAVRQTSTEIVINGKLDDLVDGSKK